MSVLWLRHNNKNNITKTDPVPDPVPVPVHGNSLQCGLDDKNGCLLIKQIVYKKFVYTVNRNCMEAKALTSPASGWHGMAQLG